ncbi:MAG: hypothetical protein AB7G28_16765 [Pirellulales bacterium]
MSRVEWIVCERTTRWASALRRALAAAAGDEPVRLRELRSMTELDAELVARPHAFAAIEIHRGNFGALVAWLSEARERHAGATRAVLVDRSMARDIDPIVAVLLEASAQAVATSPRKLESLVAMSQRGSKISANMPTGDSFVDEVWTSLPWQAV